MSLSTASFSSEEMLFVADTDNISLADSNKSLDSESDQRDEEETVVYDTIEEQQQQSYDPWLQQLANDHSIARINACLYI